MMNKLKKLKPAQEKELIEKLGKMTELQIWGEKYDPDFFE